MSGSAVKWFIRLAVIRKLAHLLARVAPSTQSLARRLHYFHPGVLLVTLSDWWCRRTRFFRHLVSNMFVGMTIALALAYMHHIHNPWLTEFEDAGMDWVMQMHVGTNLSETAIPIAWIDIDEDSYRRWGEPLYTPRKKLARLIEYAAESNPLAIIVDIDLRQSGDHQSDDALMEYIRNYSLQSRPPLILARTFRQPVNEASMACSELRNSYIENDSNITASTNIFWASTLFTQDRDRHIRHWRLWEAACTEEGDPVVVPSIQLLVAAIVRSSDVVPVDAVRMLDDELRNFAPADCKAGHLTEDKDSCHTSVRDVNRINVGGLVLDSSPSQIQQRLIYSIPWQRPSSGHVLRGESLDQLFIRHSAYPVTDGNQNIDRSWLSGRVVIIGGSYVDARDNHATPIGEQPGALILANAINSLLQYGQIQPPTTWQKLIIEAFLILVMSLAFAWFTSFWGMLVSGLVIITVLLPVSFFAFKYGVWLDFAVPLIAVQLHQMAAEFEESRKCPKSENQLPS